MYNKSKITSAKIEDLIKLILKVRIFEMKYYSNYTCLLQFFFHYFYPCDLYCFARGVLGCCFSSKSPLLQITIINFFIPYIQLYYIFNGSSRWHIIFQYQKKSKLFENPKNSIYWLHVGYFFKHSLYKINLYSPKSKEKLVFKKGFSLKALE